MNECIPIERIKRTLHGIRQRCENSTVPGFKYYGGKGVKCLISFEELKTLWTRDKGHKLKRPSIDRIDSEKDYSFENCRFIELSENVRNRHAFPFKKPPQKGIAKYFAQIGKEGGKSKSEKKIQASRLNIEKARKARKWKPPLSEVEL